MYSFTVKSKFHNYNVDFISSIEESFARELKDSDYIIIDKNVFNLFNEKLLNIINNKRKILIGWMSNWQYANIVPTEKFRNAFTLPRELGLAKIGDELYLKSMPVAELKTIEQIPIIKKDIIVNQSLDLTTFIGKLSTPSKHEFKFTNQNSYSFEFSNNLNEKVIIGYNKEKNSFFIDRTKSGKVDFEKDFARINFAPRLSNQEEISLIIYLDRSSIEIFADNGLSLLTSVVFPNEDYNKILMFSSKISMINKFTYTPMKPIW